MRSHLVCTTLCYIVSHQSQVLHLSHMLHLSHLSHVASGNSIRASISQDTGMKDLELVHVCRSGIRCMQYIVQLAQDALARVFIARKRVEQMRQHVRQCDSGTSHFALLPYMASKPKKKGENYMDAPKKKKRKEKKGKKIMFVLVFSANVPL